MEQKTFESYLQDEFMKDYHGDKEHFEDSYEGWLENKDVAEIMELAEKMLVDLYKEHAEEVRLVHEFNG